MAYLPQILLSLPLVHTGHSYTVTCILQQTACGWCVSTVLAKSIIVIIAFHLTGPGRKMRSLLISGAAKFIILFCVLIQLTLCGMLLKTTALFIYVCVYAEHGHIITVCKKIPLCSGTLELSGPRGRHCGFPGQKITWHHQWSQGPGFQHAGILQCLGAIPPCLLQHQVEGDGGCGGLLHLDPGYSSVDIYLFPEMSHYFSKTQ